MRRHLNAGWLMVIVPLIGALLAAAGSCMVKKINETKLKQNSIDLHEPKRPQQ